MSRVAEYYFDNQLTWKQSMSKTYSLQFVILDQKARVQNNFDCFAIFSLETSSNTLCLFKTRSNIFDQHQPFKRFRSKNIKFWVLAFTQGKMSLDELMLALEMNFAKN